MAGAASAQIYISDVRFDANGVNNDGIVVGSQDQNMPILLWDAKKGGDASAFTNIGGISAGQGIGGVARFSGDGKFVSAPMPCENIPVVAGWEKSVYNDFAYTYNDILYISDYNLFAIGESADGKSGILLKSANNGVSWIKIDGFFRPDEAGGQSVMFEPAALTSIAPLSNWQILLGGKDGGLYFGQGTSFSPIDLQPEGDDKEVGTYWAMDFLYGLYDDGTVVSETATYGVIGVEYTDGSYAVWYTEDTGDTFAKATGVSGVPQYITHAGNTFFMVTKDGRIQKSEDYGKTWTDVYQTSGGEPFYRIKFADAKRGIATSDNFVYLTQDGGATWSRTTVLPTGIWTKVRTRGGDTDEVAWYDATWSGDTLTVAGSQGQVYRSVDNGSAFAKLSVDDSYTGAYTAMIYKSGAYSLFGQEGNFYRNANITSVNGYCAGVYDIENEVWTPMASTGYLSGEVASAPWQFSGDGKTVVGNVYARSKVTNLVNAHAAAMSADEVIDLGSKFDNINRATVALGVSYDGSVIVGWQDIFGPRFGAVWTRNEDGSYTQRMMLKDTSKDEDDINYDDKQDCYDNLVASARSVSPDGKWIGGDGSVGDSAFPGPWIWNEEEGYTLIFDDAEVDGSVAAVSNNGEKAVGWQGLGSSAWIYTKDGGVQYLQDYVTNVLGCDLGDFYIMSAYDMSPNGRYVCGYGMRGQQVLGYMIDLEGKGTSIEDKVVSQTKASVYPNPVSDELHVDLPYGAEDVKTTLTLVDMQGCAVRRVETVQTSNIINVSNLPQGIYILDVNARGSHKAFKVVVKH